MSHRDDQKRAQERENEAAKREGRKPRTVTFGVVKGKVQLFWAPTGYEAGDDELEDKP